MGRGSYDAAERRRAQVAQLWIRGVSIRDIAQAVHVDPRTITRDLKRIRTQLAQERLRDFDGCLTRSLAVIREVEQQAWATYAKADARSVNKVAALRVILDAESQIARLEGTSQPESVTVAVLADLKTVLLDVLDELGEPARELFLARLREQSFAAGAARTALGGIAGVVGADTDDEHDADGEEDER